jgi:hypothetical protein
MSDERDIDNLRHFASRSQQPKVLVSSKRMSIGNTPPAPVQISIIYDNGWGGVTDQIDGTRFKYTGTSPGVSKYENMTARRRTQYW